MKNLLRFLPLLALVLFTCTADSNENDFDNDNFLARQNQPPCVNDDPITRLINNGTITYELIVVDENGVEVVNFESIPPNSTTSWASFNTGLYIFYLKNANSSPSSSHDKVQLQMENCTALEIEIDGNDEVLSFIPTSL